MGTIRGGESDLPLSISVNRGIDAAVADTATTTDEILETARNSATTEATRNRLEEIRSYPGYAEPGCAPTKVVYLGDWNAPDFYDFAQGCRVEVQDGHLVPQLKEALEKAGVDTEWDDEWASCHDCGRIARTIPDWMGWQSFLIFNLSEGSCLCRDCYAGAKHSGASMKVFWKGLLALNGDSEEFEAEIVEGPNGPSILRHKGLGVEEISPHRINNEYLLKAVAIAASEKNHA